MSRFVSVVIAAALGFLGGPLWAGPAARSAARRPARSVARPAARPTARPAARPTARPAARPTARPAARPTFRPVARPTARPAAGGCTVVLIKRIRALNIKAQGEYDNYDFEAAGQDLKDAITLAKKTGCTGQMDVAKSYLYLGVVHVEGFKDFQSGKQAWFNAFSIVPGIQIPRRMATPRLLRSFRLAKRMYKVQAPRSGGAQVRKQPPVPQGPPKGLEHLPATEAVETQDLTITCRVADALGASRVTLYYRPAFAASYRTVNMTKQGKWSWKGTVPGKDVRGRSLGYYLVVWNAQNKAIAASGNAASPNMVSLKVASAASGQGPAVPTEENPLMGRHGHHHRARHVASTEVEIPGARKGRTFGSGGVSAGPVGSNGGPSQEKGAHHPRRPAVIMVTAGLGMGLGLLNGTTEVARNGYDFSVHQKVPTSLSMGTLYGQFGLAYILAPWGRLGIVARVGKTFISKAVYDAAQGNTYDWLVLGRFRYTAPVMKAVKNVMGWRWYAGGGLGYGVFRHHVRAKDVQVEEGKKVDVTDTDLAKGVVPNGFAGVELNFLHGYLNVFLELNYMAAFASVPEDNLYFHMDLTLGLTSEF